ncbi:hypothetical protein KFU94_28765 [Chloroflexi bacterium TSY]|nr:hypothetical protein [Chloroflexi bacterium TSY]
MSKGEKEEVVSSRWARGWAGARSGAGGHLSPPDPIPLPPRARLVQPITPLIL